MVSLHELKDRKLVQWALAYAAGAWLVLEVVDTLGANFGWPRYVFQVLSVFLVMGFFAALILAWYHGEKGRQKVSTVELGLLTGVLVLAGVGVAWVRAPAPDGPTVAHGGTAAVPSLAPGSTAEQGSIAVLPFVNMSSDPEQEYFSDGITEELLNVLAQLPELRVAARTSAFAFKGGDVGIDSIAHALNVRHVLEGSVRKAGERVRVTAQLIDAQTGYHVWSDTYDGELRDIFAVQDEIARQIVRQLEIRLSGAGEQGRLAKVQTSDPEAHQLYLRARQIALNGGGEPSTWLTPAEQLYEQAIARDSAYAAAWAGLANVHRLQAQFSMIPREAGLEKARREAERALRLNPAEGDAHVVLGIVAYEAGERSAAGEHFERALRANPSDARTLGFYSGWIGQMGRIEEAVRGARRAVELDPLSVAVLSAAGDIHQSAADLLTAAEMFERALALVPGDPVLLRQLAMTRVLLGERTDALRMAERVLEIAPRSAGLVSHAGWVYAYARDFHRAVALFRRAVELAPENATYHAYLANALVMVGSGGEAVRVAQRAAELDPENDYVQTIRAYVYAKIGQAEAAQRAMRALPEDDLFGRAAVHANLGETDRAFALLDEAVQERKPGIVELGADWWFDALRGDPRMDRLLERVGVPEVATRYRSAP